MHDWHRILIAVNNTETSMKAVRFVGEILTASKAISVILLHVYPDPHPDHFKDGGTLESYKEKMNKEGQKTIYEAADVLKDYGFPEEIIHGDIRMAQNISISKAVLAAQQQHKCGTVVVGKRGVCRAEEFLFGSISNDLARETQDFTTWVVG